MFRIPMRWHLPVALVALVAAAAHAQTAAPPPSPPSVADPANPQAQVPRALHAAAFAGYRRHADAAPIAWKEANDTVTRIGGWRTYAREAAAPSLPAASTPARRTAP